MTGTEKKGLGPLGWVLIGCGSITLIGIIAAVVVTSFVFKKGKEFVDNVEKHPEITAAKLIAAGSPEIEFVDGDDEAQIITFRNEKTGEEIQVNYQDIKEGKISFVTEDGESTIEFNEDEESGGSLTFNGPDGSASFSAGEDLKDQPEWIPIYPGTEPKSAFDAKTEKGRSLTFQFTTDDSIDDVLDFYKNKLENVGFNVSVNRISGATDAGALTGRNTATNTEIGLTLAIDAGVTNVIVQANERQKMTNK